MILSGTPTLLTESATLVDNTASAYTLPEPIKQTAQLILANYTGARWKVRTGTGTAAACTNTNFDFIVESGTTFMDYVRCTWVSIFPDAAGSAAGSYGTANGNSSTYSVKCRSDAQMAE
jgi:hypothetical protein